jgi:hypothetical protein
MGDRDGDDFSADGGSQPPSDKGDEGEAAPQPSSQHAMCDSPSLIMRRCGSGHLRWPLSLPQFVSCLRKAMSVDLSSAFARLIDHHACQDRHAPQLSTHHDFFLIPSTRTPPPTSRRVFIWIAHASMRMECRQNYYSPGHISSLVLRQMISILFHSSAYLHRKPPRSQM